MRPDDCGRHRPSRSKNGFDCDRRVAALSQRCADRGSCQSMPGCSAFSAHSARVQCAPHYMRAFRDREIGCGPFRASTRTHDTGAVSHSAGGKVAVGTNLRGVLQIGHGLNGCRGEQPLRRPCPAHLAIRLMCWTIEHMPGNHPVRAIPSQSRRHQACLDHF
jgi:hypothetical protein